MTAYQVGGAAVLVVAHGLVADFEGCAIVNSANEECLFGGSIDYAVKSIGGPALQKARNKLPLLGLNPDVCCHTGQAVITKSGGLGTEWCIHAVGPDFREAVYKNPSETEGIRLLESAYGVALKLAQEKGLKFICCSQL